MTPKRWAVLGLLVLALAGTQHFGLETTPETKKENALRNLPEVSAGDMLPTYVASLFFGAFRAVAIDVLWIQLKRAEEERRWYERREILKMISYVQPRNPEVWSHLGWHSAYNVANGFTDPEKSWSWVRFGLTWLRQGTRMLPDNPHLKYELAFTLMHKPSWRDAELDLPLLRRIEADEQLQNELRPDDVPRGGPPLSSFALARLWLERAKADIRRAGTKPHKTQMGLFIYPSTLDGYIRKTLFLDGIRAWQEGDVDTAVRYAREAEAHVRAMMKTPYEEGFSSIAKDWAAFYAGLPEVIRLRGPLKTPPPTREKALAALKAMQGLVARWDQPIDEGFIWSRTDPGAPLNALKRGLVGPADQGECNDSWGMAWSVRPGELASANLAPAGLDVDWYLLEINPPSENAPPKELKLRVSITRPATSGAELKITAYNPLVQSVKTFEARGKADLEIPAGYGFWSLKVEPLDPKADPADSRYYLQWGVAE